VFLYHVCCDVSDTSRTRDFEDDIDAKQINLPTPPLLEIAEILNAQFHSRFAPEFKQYLVNDPIHSKRTYQSTQLTKKALSFRRAARSAVSAP
jgi:hypothetical protein